MEAVSTSRENSSKDGPTQSKGVWRIRYNDEIYKMYKDVPLSTYTGLKRLMRAGHVVRMEEYSIPKKVLGRCFGGERPVGDYEIYGIGSCDGATFRLSTAAGGLLYYPQIKANVTERARSARAKS
jgi:hypothetical protein